MAFFHNVDINSLIWKKEKLIGQIILIRHSALHCICFYVVMSVLNKTVTIESKLITTQRYWGCVDKDLKIKCFPLLFSVSDVKLRGPEMCRVIFRRVNETLWSGGLDSDEFATDSAARWTPLLCLLSQITSHNVTFASFSQTSSLIRSLVCCSCSCSC